MDSVEKLINFVEKNKIDNKQKLEENDEFNELLFRALYDKENISKIEEKFKELNLSDWLDAKIDKIKKDGAFVLKKIIDNSPDFLPLLFSNTIIINQSEKIFKEMANIYTNEELNLAADELYDIVDYCLKYNYSGEKYSAILIDYYHCPKQHADILSDLFDKNRIELKLNYIIQNLEEKK